LTRAVPSTAAQRGMPRTIFIGVGLLLGATFVANAQPRYDAQPQNQVRPDNRLPPGWQAGPYTPQPSYPLPGTPPSWSYDPYTDGTVKTPNANGGS
jgi:hypothetical protein